jgi:hypothetical protein
MLWSVAMLAAHRNELHKWPTHILHHFPSHICTHKTITNSHIIHKQKKNSLLPSSSCHYADVIWSRTTGKIPSPTFIKFVEILWHDWRFQSDVHTLHCTMITLIYLRSFKSAKKHKHKHKTSKNMQLYRRLTIARCTSGLLQSDLTSGISVKEAKKRKWWT